MNVHVTGRGCAGISFRLCMAVIPTDGYKVIKRFNLACRHSRLRGNDDQRLLDLRERVNA